MDKLCRLPEHARANWHSGRRTWSFSSR